MKKSVFKYLAIATAVLFILPAGAYFGEQHATTAERVGGQIASPNSVTYINPDTIPPNVTVRAAPPPAIPRNVQPLTFVMAHNYVTVDGNTPGHPDIVYLNVTLPNTPWQAVILNYSGTSIGLDFDTRALMSVDNVTVFRDICAENGYYDVLANLTSYEPLFHGYTQMWFSPPADAFQGQGEYISNVTISFYAGSAPKGLPNAYIPVIPTTAVVLTSSNDNATVNMTVPSNTLAATLQIWITGSGFDESWYADEPSYRALQVWSGGDLVANVLPYYHVRSGELDLFAWRGLMSPFELDDRPYNVNVTGALGILEGNNNITVHMVNPSPLGGYWIIRVNELLWTSNAVMGATQISYSSSTHTLISTDVYMPNAGSPTNGGNVSTQSYFFSDVNVGIAYSSLITTTTGSILASKATTETSYMNQYSINAIWQNWTAYQLTTSVMKTTYMESNNNSILINTKISYFPFEADTGFSFTVTQTTNGGFPMYGPFASYLENTYIAYNIIHIYTNTTDGITTRAMTSLSNSFFVDNGVFAGVIELLNAVSGVISQITTITSTTLRVYTWITYNTVGGELQPVSGYQHILEAVSNNPPGPLYFGTIVLDEIYTF